MVYLTETPVQERMIYFWLSIIPQAQNNGQDSMVHHKMIMEEK